MARRACARLDQVRVLASRRNFAEDGAQIVAHLLDLLIAITRVFRHRAI
jgi:hypothetical protein